MKTIRPYTTVYVETTDARIRPMRVLTVVDQDNITGRIGLAGNSASVTAQRQASTQTRGTLFVQV